MEQSAPAKKSSLLPYILVSLIFITASAGMYYLSQSLVKTPKPPLINSTQIPIPKVSPTSEVIPTSESNDSFLSSLPTQATTLYTPTNTTTNTITNTITNTDTPIVLGPTLYTSKIDLFSVNYDNSKRKIAEFTQGTNHRYVFYRQDGRNEVVHVGPTWSWVHPSRVLNPTFRYDTPTQTIVDQETSTKKYTLQCVHDGLPELKSECESFINSFKINP